MILRQKVAEKWHTGDVDPRIHTLPPAIVTFDLMRDGSVKNVHVARAAGTRRWITPRSAPSTTPAHFPRCLPPMNGTTPPLNSGLS
jgi:hypothetical protein